jgi:hypothetical protein
MRHATKRLDVKLHCESSLLNGGRLCRSEVRHLSALFVKNCDSWHCVILQILVWI